MEKVLRKRAWRDLKENKFRYFALAFLIIISMYLVISLVGAADTIVDGTTKQAKKHKLEDGQFQVFVPLTTKQKENFTKKGLTVEETFYLDFRQKDGSKLRIFKNRKKVNKINLDEGRLAKNKSEVVVEKRYAQEHNLKTGSKITIDGNFYKITGIGSVPDYDACYEKLSDSTVDSKQFGLAFVTEDAYENLKDNENSIIGTLYALGVIKKQLLKYYLTVPVIVTFLAGLAGTIIGYSPIGIPTQMQDCYDYFSIPDLSPELLIYLLVYGIVMPPLVAVIVNYFVIRKKLSRPALSMIRNEQKKSHISKVKLGDMPFLTKFRIRQSLREARAGFTVVFGMFIALLVMMIGLDCYVMCDHISKENKKDTKFEYMYTYKYPDKKVPKGGDACFVKGLHKEVWGYDLEISLIGIENDNPYFSQDKDLPKAKNKVVISSAMAQKYDLKKGDSIILSDEEDEMDYAFQVADITQYSSGLYAFMDIDSMRDLFQTSSDYYNMVVSKKKLSIDSGKLYATTSKKAIEESSDVFINMMIPMMGMIVGLSVIIFAIVMYLMIKVMIDRSAQNIALMKVFGYRKKEIKKLYLDGNFYMIAIGALISVPLSKKLMDAMYPVMVSNIACGMNLSFTWQMYALIYAGIIITYLVINKLLVRKIYKVGLSDALKNRE